MSKESFRYEFTAKELKYLLLGKKKCPMCGGKLKRSKGYETVEGSKFNTNSVPLYIQGRQVNQYHYIFTCKECKKMFTLTELAK